MLITIGNVLDKAEVGQIRKRLDEGRWQDGARTAGTLSAKVKHNQQLDERSELSMGLANQVLLRLGENQLFISAALPGKIYPPKFNRYADGGNYDTHVDSAIMHVPGANVTVRSDLSATLFLSEPHEYDGGELEIEGSAGRQRVKLDAGDMVVYPSSSLHRVTAVTRGVRNACFFWVESLVADDGARTLLFDLDQSIQSLTRTLPAGDPTVLMLTGIYHNLMRRWART